MQVLIQTINGNSINLVLAHVLDNHEIFSNLNNNAVEFSIKFVADDQGRGLIDGHQVEYLFVANRNMQVLTSVNIDGEPLRKPENKIAYTNNHISINGKSVASLQTISETFLSLSNSLYIGPFRNTINAGTKTDYLDIQIGQSFITQFRELKTGSSKKSNTDISRLTEDIRKVFQFAALAGC